MKTIGFDRPLYILPFDHRGSFEKKLFGWHGDFRRRAAMVEGQDGERPVEADGLHAEPLILR